MTKLLLSLALFSGCMSAAHLTVTQKDCAPPALVGADVVLGGAATLVGVTGDEPKLVAVGAVYLGFATLLMFSQMSECIP